MNCTWQQTVAPTSDLIELGDAKGHLRISVEDEDADTLRRIAAVTRQIEEYLGRGLLTQTWEYRQDVFADVILLPRAAPLQSVSSVQYYDESGTLQTLATTTYVVDSASEPGRILLAPNKVWPTTQAARALAVIVTYVVGWTHRELVPPDIVDGAYLLLGDRHEHREASVSEDAALACLTQQRVWWREPVGA